jgi:hypothetical protein
MSLPVIGMLPQPHKQGNFYGENNPAISFYHNIQRNNTPQNNSDNRYSNMYGNTTTTNNNNNPFNYVGQAFFNKQAPAPTFATFTQSPSTVPDYTVSPYRTTANISNQTTGMEDVLVQVKQQTRDLKKQSKEWQDKNNTYIKELGSLMEKLMGNMEKEKETGNIFKDFGQGFLKGKENVRAGNTTRFGGFFERLINPNKSYDDTGNSKNLNNTTSNPPQWI